LPEVVTAKVERFAIAFGVDVESGGFVRSRSADGIFGNGFRFFHGQVSSRLWSLSFDSGF
jgi:hypothetical protein